MSSPSRNRVESSTPISISAAADFYNKISHEWNLLAKESNAGNLKGISLLPANCGVAIGASNNSNSSTGRRSMMLNKNNKNNNVSSQQERQHLRQFSGAMSSGATRSYSPHQHVDPAASTTTGNSSSSPSISTTTMTPSGFSLFGFELFLLGGDVDENEDDDDNNDFSDFSPSSSTVITNQQQQQSPQKNKTQNKNKNSALLLTGFVTVGSKQSPWYSGTFEFIIELRPGYPEHSCPLLYFTSTLSHPELRGGTQLPVVSEIFASAHSNNNNYNFLLRDCIDEVRQLFVQPHALFSKQQLVRAGLDVKYCSVTSPYFGLAQTQMTTEQFDAEVKFWEEEQSSYELLLQHQKRHQATTSSPSTIASPSLTNNTVGEVEEEEQNTTMIAKQKAEEEALLSTPALRFQKHVQQRNNNIAAISPNHNNNNNNDLELGIIFSEANVPFVLQRWSQQKIHQIAEKEEREKEEKKKIDEISQKSVVSPKEEKTTEEGKKKVTPDEILDEQAKKATVWIGQSVPTSTSSFSLKTATATSATMNYSDNKEEMVSNFDSWMNRRLMRVFLPQVSNVS